MDFGKLFSDKFTNIVRTNKPLKEVNPFDEIIQNLKSTNSNAPKQQLKQEIKDEKVVQNEETLEKIDEDNPWHDDLQDIVQETDEKINYQIDQNDIKTSPSIIQSSPQSIKSLFLDDVANKVEEKSGMLQKLGIKTNILPLRSEQVLPKKKEPLADNQEREAILAYMLQVFDMQELFEIQKQEEIQKIEQLRENSLQEIEKAKTELTASQDYLRVQQAEVQLQILEQRTLLKMNDIIMQDGDLVSKLQQLVQENISLKDDIVGINQLQSQTIEDYEDQISQIQNGFQRQFQQQEAKITEANQKLQQATQNILRKEKRMIVSQSKMQEMLSEIHKLKEQLRLIKENSSLKAQDYAKQFQANIVKFQNTFNEEFSIKQLTYNRQVQYKIQAKDNEIANLKQRINEQQNQLKDTHQSFQQLLKDQDLKLNNMNKIMQQYEQNISALTQKNQQKDDKILQLQKQIDTLQEETADILELNGELKAQVKTKEAQMKDLIEQNEKIRSQSSKQQTNSLDNENDIWASFFQPSVSKNQNEEIQNLKNEIYQLKQERILLNQQPVINDDPWGIEQVEDLQNNDMVQIEVQELKKSNEEQLQIIQNLQNQLQIERDLKDKQIDNLRNLMNQQEYKVNLLNNEVQDKTQLLQVREKMLIDLTVNYEHQDIEIKKIQEESLLLNQKLKNSEQSEIAQKEQLQNLQIQFNDSNEQKKLMQDYIEILQEKISTLQTESQIIKQPPSLNFSTNLRIQNSPGLNQDNQEQMSPSKIHEEKQITKKVQIVSEEVQLQNNLVDQELPVEFESCDKNQIFKTVRDISQQVKTVPLEEGWGIDSNQLQQVDSDNKNPIESQVHFSLEELKSNQSQENLQQQYSTGKQNFQQYETQSEEQGWELAEPQIEWDIQQPGNQQNVTNEQDSNLDLDNQVSNDKETEKLKEIVEFQNQENNQLYEEQYQEFQYDIKKDNQEESQNDDQEIQHSVQLEHQVKYLNQDQENQESALNMDNLNRQNQESIQKFSQQTEEEEVCSSHKEQLQNVQDDYYDKSGQESYEQVYINDKKIEYFAKEECCEEIIDQEEGYVIQMPNIQFYLNEQQQNELQDKENQLGLNMQKEQKNELNLDENQEINKQQLKKFQQNIDENMQEKGFFKVEVQQNLENQNQNSIEDGGNCQLNIDEDNLQEQEQLNDVLRSSPQEKDDKQDLKQFEPQQEKENEIQSDQRQKCENVIEQEILLIPSQQVYLQVSSYGIDFEKTQSFNNVENFLGEPFNQIVSELINNVGQSHQNSNNISEHILDDQNLIKSQENLISEEVSEKVFQNQEYKEKLQQEQQEQGEKNLQENEIIVDDFVWVQADTQLEWDINELKQDQQQEEQYSDKQLEKQEEEQEQYLNKNYEESKDQFKVKNQENQEDCKDLQDDPEQDNQKQNQVLLKEEHNYEQDINQQDGWGIDLDDPQLDCQQASNSKEQYDQKILKRGIINEQVYGLLSQFETVKNFEEEQKKFNEENQEKQNFIMKEQLKIDQENQQKIIKEVYIRIDHMDQDKIISKIIQQEENENQKIMKNQDLKNIDQQQQGYNEFKVQSNGDQEETQLQPEEGWGDEGWDLNIEEIEPVFQNQNLQIEDDQINNLINKLDQKE